jgi:general secretion pathway protein F
MKFSILAVDARQQVVALTRDAASEALAADQARARGLNVISLECKSIRIPRRRARFPATLFSVELLSLLEAGLNLVEALQTLAEKDNNDVLAAILAAIHRGEPFSQAVAALPQHFSPLYVATIKAAERTGNVREALKRSIP